MTTTAKIPHPYEYVHDEVGYNYRLPNLNAAIACAQLEQLEKFIENKRELAKKYSDFFRDWELVFLKNPKTLDQITGSMLLFWTILNRGIVSWILPINAV